MYGLSDRSLDFVAFGDGLWRLCDLTLGDEHPQAIIATVERTQMGVAVVWHRGIRAPRHFSRLEDVRTAAIETLSAASGGPTRPIPIPHRPPVHGRRAAS